MALQVLWTDGQRGEGSHWGLRFEQFVKARCGVGRELRSGDTHLSSERLRKRGGLLGVGGQPGLPGEPLSLRYQNKTISGENKGLDIKPSTPEKEPLGVSGRIHRGRKLTCSALWWEGV